MERGRGEETRTTHVVPLGGWGLGGGCFVVRGRASCGWNVIGRDLRVRAAAGLLSSALDPKRSTEGAMNVLCFAGIHCPLPSDCLGGGVELSLASGCFFYLKNISASICCYVLYT